MKVSVTLLTSEKSNEDGYPIILKVSHLKERPYEYIGRAWPEHWSDDARIVNENHPFYSIMAQKILNLKSRGKELLLTWSGTPKELLDKILQTDRSGITIKEYGDIWIKEQTELMKVQDQKGNIDERNRIGGYIRSIENALNQFTAFRPKGVAVAALDYEMLQAFRRDRELAGNSKATISLYLSAVRKLYNDACLRYKIADSKPFKSIYNGLVVKSYNSKKKHLDRDTVAVLEGIEGLGVEYGRARDLWLLQFYFGGCDLIDLYFLRKSQLKRGRVRFSRGKTDGAVIDLKVHPKAQAIIDRWGAVEGEYLFPWNKDLKYYDNWRNRHGKHLREFQSKQNDIADAAKDKNLRIDVQPGGGHLAIKVARHTFGNIAKSLGVDGDLLREIMGHERNDVDNFYKDQYPQAVRDEALFKVIG